MAGITLTEGNYLLEDYHPEDDPRDHPTMPAVVRIILMLLLPVVFLVGIIGNVLVLWIFCRSKALRIPQNVMIINLAVTDLLMVLTLFPMMFISTVHGKWYLKDEGCQLDGFCGALFGISSISTLTVIAINRCYSLERFHSISYSRAMVMLVMTWLYSFFWAILPYLGVGEYVTEGYSVSCTFEYLNQSISNKIYVGFLYCGAFAIPVMVITACYVKIYVKIRANNRSLVEFNDSPGGKCVSGGGGGKRSDRSRRERLRLHKMESQIGQIGVILTLLFIMSWTPYATVALIGQYINPELIVPYPLLQLVPVFFAKCSSIWNPFVYAIKHTNFKAALRVHLSQCLRSSTANHNVNRASGSITFTMEKSRNTSTTRCGHLLKNIK